MDRFPHLNDTQFPGVGNIDVYKYQNNFDYSRWTANTTIKVMRTNLDPNYENVGGWESKATRNAYFDGLEGASVTLTSALHMKPDNSIKLPFPPSVMSMYDYVMVVLPTATSTAQQVDYENDTQRVTRYFYFVTDIIQRAENATQCVLELDYWTTYACNAGFKSMMLERGHYPLANTGADSYLAAPNQFSDLLRAPDVNAGDADVVKYAHDVVFNTGDMYACIATTARPTGDWGMSAEDDDKTPATRSYYAEHGVGTICVFAIAASSLQSFLEDVETKIPQFKQTVKAVFFVPQRYVTHSSTFEFLDYVCYRLTPTQQVNSLITFTRDRFGYPFRYANLAKLYTYPYAHVEVSDGENVTIIKIEDTSGYIDALSTVQLAWPYISFDAYLNGVGGSGGERTITFKNLSAASIHVSGRWYETLKRWNIPTFGIIQSGAKENSYSALYERAKRYATNATAQSNAKKLARTAADNATRTNTTIETNEYNIAQNISDNADVHINAATSIASHGNRTAGSVTTFGNGLNTALQAWDAGLTRGTTQVTNDAVAAAAVANTVGNLVGQIGSGALSGGLAGAAAGVGAGVASGITNGVTTAITITKNQQLAELTITNTGHKVTETNTNNLDVLLQQQNHVAHVTDVENGVRDSVAYYDMERIKTNATNTKNTNIANATATKDAAYWVADNTKSNSDDAVSYDTKQAALNAPALFGEFSNGETASTRPVGFFAQIVTQPAGAIRIAGDAFLRYGYALDQYVEVATLNVMPKFSYWKASDVWMDGKGLTAGARTRLRAILSAGVTVWRNPSEIGKVGIYDNN